VSVVATDSGHLISLDLSSGTEIAAIDIGPGASSVVIGDGDAVEVSRYDTGTTGEGIVVVSGRDHAVRGIATMALGGLAVGEAGTVWALEKAGNVLHVDPATGRILGRVAVVVDVNEHMEIVAGAGARWVSSDHTPVRRIAAETSMTCRSPACMTESHRNGTWRHTASRLGRSSVLESSQTAPALGPSP